MPRQYYITTPIYYVNDKPHIGHAYTSLACDMIARFKRLDGFDVKFLSGTDEHGQKVAKSAEKRGISPQEFTDEVSQTFRHLGEAMNFSYDDFIRTTEARHKLSASSFWERLEENGYIYRGKYSGWYSVRDEAFYAEDELVDGKAPTGAEVEWTEEETYFFKLSAFQGKLLQFYDENPGFIAPKSRRNEVVSFVRGGKEMVEGALKDLSVSRTSFDWGVAVPGDEKHVMYVWLDALTNYLSAINYPDVSDSEFQKFWPADIHIVGKDILRFHAVYWPAFLMAADLPLPKKIFAHGWWTNEGEKISKSVGNVINPLELIEEFGLDQTRYFLMRQVTFGNDGDFSREELTRRINGDLANNLGNLVQRSLSMIQKNCAGKVPSDSALKDEDKKLLNSSYQLIEKLRELIDVQNLSGYLEEVMGLASSANEYIDEQAPWALKKTDPARMEIVLYTLAETIRVLGLYVLPIMPDAATKILDQLVIKNEERNFAVLNYENCLKPGSDLPIPQGIFPRI